MNVFGVLHENVFGASANAPKMLSLFFVLECALTIFASKTDKFDRVINTGKQWDLDLLLSAEVYTNLSSRLSTERIVHMLSKRINMNLEQSKEIPRTLDFISALKNIIGREHWRYGHLITKADMQDTFQKRLKIDGCVLSYIAMDTEEAYLSQLLRRVTRMESIRQLRNIMNFVVVGNVSAITNILTQAESLDKLHGVSSVFRHFSKWLLIPIDGGLNLQTNFDNIAILEETNTGRQQKNITQVLPAVVRRYQLCLGLELTDCQEEFHRTMERFIEVRTATISTLLWKKEGRIPSLVATVSWSGKTNWMSKPFPNENYGLNGRQLRLTIKEWLPYAIKRYDDYGPAYDGVCPTMIASLAQTFNFTYYFTEPGDGQWGQLEGDNWTGLVGDVQHQIADMSGVWIGKDYHRIWDVDFAITMYLNPYTVIYNPLPEKHPFTYLIRQFKPDVYVCGFGVFMAVLVLFILFEFTYPYKSTGVLRSDQPVYKRIGELTLMMTASSLHQGVKKPPSSGAGKILLAFWLLYTLIITAIYCGNLIAFRAVTKDTKPFKSISEMLERKDFVFGLEGESLLENILKLSSDSEFKILWRRLAKAKETDPTVTSAEPYIHYNRLQGGNYAFIVDGLSLPTIKRNNCRIISLETEFLQTPYTFAFPKNSPLPKMFNSELMMFVENGMVHMLMNKWLNTNQCEDSKNVSKPMKILDYVSAIIASAVGVCVAILVLLAEAVCAAKPKSKRNKEDQL